MSRSQGRELSLATLMLVVMLLRKDDNMINWFNDMTEGAETGRNLQFVHSQLGST